MELVAGRDYPGSYAQVRAWFDEDWKCLDYLVCFVKFFPAVSSLVFLPGWLGFRPFGRQG